MNSNQILPINFKAKLFIQLFIGFIIATIIGTMTVFSGAFIIAKSLGLEFKIHYNGFSTGPGCVALHANLDYIDSIQKMFPDEIKNYIDFPEKQRYLDELKIRKTRMRNHFLVATGTFAFPLLIGMAGMIFLFKYKNKYTNHASLNFKKWILIFLSLFWLRAAIDVWAKLFKLIFKRFKYYSLDSSISYYLNMGKEGFPIIECLVVTTILFFVVFRFIPKQERFTFLLSGLIGGITGVYLWFFLIGKYILF